MRDGCEGESEPAPEAESPVNFEARWKRTFLENAFCPVCTMMKIDIAFGIAIRYSDRYSLSIAIIPQVKERGCLFWLSLSQLALA